MTGLLSRITQTCLSTEKHFTKSMDKNYQSQFGEDKWLDENLRLPDKGFYLDVGAARPNLISNTSFLRTRGWQGIQIDPNAQYADEWAGIGYPLTVGVVFNGEDKPFKNYEHPDLSRIEDGGNIVPTINLNQLLESKAVAKIDLLSIDIEGLEYDVLTTLDFGKYSPQVIIWEFNTMGKQDHRLCSFLESLGYKQAHKTFCNYIHVR